jgi:hypothetical protein
VTGRTIRLVGNVDRTTFDQVAVYARQAYRGNVADAVGALIKEGLAARDRLATTRTDSLTSKMYEALVRIHRGDKFHPSVNGNTLRALRKRGLVAPNGPYVTLTTAGMAEAQGELARRSVVLPSGT